MKTGKSEAQNCMDADAYAVTLFVNGMTARECKVKSDEIKRVMDEEAAKALKKINERLFIRTRCYLYGNPHKDAPPYIDLHDVVPVIRIPRPPKKLTSYNTTDINLFDTSEPQENTCWFYDIQRIYHHKDKEGVIEKVDYHFREGQ